MSGNETILIIDDEEMIRRMVSSILEDYGYKCLTAENGIKALEIYKDQRENIDLVLLDMIMPIMSGERVYEELRKINPQARVIMSSGFPFEDESDPLQSGVEAFISKPYQESQLAQVIRQVL